ncbi:MAG: hypothetical protein PHE88_07345 [Elusimicrobia bacterium]|nr:hypothetical protein [Elusimicrobiota bacterium]
MAIDDINQSGSVFDEFNDEYHNEKKEEVKKKPIVIEPFCRNLSQSVTYWQMTPEDIQVLKNKGFGYSELIKIILISKKTEKPLTDVVTRRNRGEDFKKICERYAIDYNEIKKETKRIKLEVIIYEPK